MAVSEPFPRVRTRGWLPGRLGTAGRADAWRLGRLAVAAAVRRPAAVVAGLAGAAALFAVVFSATVFPNLSDNNDEAVYLLQADALRHGHLFPPAPEPAESFRPWLSTPTERGFVSKYTPVYPTFLAAARILTGSYRSALALAAAGAVLACYLLAKEVLGSRRQAALAAGFLTASPLFLVQSATFLSYLPTLALLMGFAAALLAGVRRRSSRHLLLAGFLLGVAAFARPYEALLFALPFGGWWAFGRRERLRTLVGEGRWLALGAAPPLAGMLVYFKLATGSFLRTPFTLLDSRDILGFGPRQMIPEYTTEIYTPLKALIGILHLGALTSFWTYGGLLTIFLILAGVRWGRGEPRQWLALVAVSVPLGYSFFWGSYGSTQWGGPWRFGPFYWILVLAPACILGAAGFRRLWRWDTRVAATAAAALFLVSTFVVGNAVRINSHFGQERARLYTAPRKAEELARQKPALVFLPDLQFEYLLQPFALARNASFDGPVVWAIDRGPTANREVARRFPDRVAYLVVAHGFHGKTAPSLHFTTSLERLAVDGNRLVRAGPV